MEMNLKGGLGNQLFQFAYLHNYVLLNPDSCIGFIPDPFARTDRPFELSELIALCNHTEHVVHGGTKHVVPLSILSRNRERILALLTHSLTSNHSGTELHERRGFQYSAPTLRHMAFNLPLSGYFQHWKYVENVWSLIQPEIELQLESINSHPRMLNKPKPQTVLHIRGGDFHAESSTTGVLSSDYYLRALKLLQNEEAKLSSVSVLTDDVEFARIIVGQLNLLDYQILGPQDCSAWEALFLMSGARQLVTANSTLSWWGAFLSEKHGGICVTPNPWHRNVPGNSTNALAHPGFRSVESGI